MKKEQFLEEKNTQLLDLGIDYLAGFDLFPKIQQSRMNKSYVTDTVTAILDYNEAKALLDEIEFCWEGQYYWPQMGLQDNNNGTIVFKFDLGDEFTDYHTVKMIIKNRHADPLLSKGQYKLIVTFFDQSTKNN